MERRDFLLAAVTASTAAAAKPLVERVPLVQSVHSLEEFIRSRDAARLEPPKGPDGRFVVWSVLAHAGQGEYPYLATVHVGVEVVTVAGDRRLEYTTVGPTLYRGPVLVEVTAKP